MQENIKYSIGLDGFCYAVFKDSAQAEDHQHLFEGCSVGCFGNFENAYQVNETLGM